MATKDCIVYVRLTHRQRAGLDHLVKSRAGNLSDHIRQAINGYLAVELPMAWAGEGEGRDEITPVLEEMAV